MRTYLLPLLLTIIFFYFSTILPMTTIYSKADLKTVRCGWPLPYLIVDKSWRDPPYPYRLKCAPNAFEEPTQILWPQPLLNIGSFYLLSLLATIFISRLLKTQPHHHL